jgi:Protein of unknown function (DUF3303)
MSRLRRAAQQHGAATSGKATSHLTPALLSTLLEAGQTRNRDFAPACAEAVDDGNCLWKGKQKVRKTLDQRILEVFSQWKAPENFKIEFFVVRVGDWGGHLLVDCDDPLTVHKFCSMLPAFSMEARPVVPVMGAVRAELEVMAWRGKITAK